MLRPSGVLTCAAPWLRRQRLQTCGISSTRHKSPLSDASEYALQQRRQKPTVLCKLAKCRTMACGCDGELAVQSPRMEKVVLAHQLAEPDRMLEPSKVAWLSEAAQS